MVFSFVFQCVVEFGVSIYVKIELYVSLRQEQNPSAPMTCADKKVSLEKSKVGKLTSKKHMCRQIIPVRTPLTAPSPESCLSYQHMTVGCCVVPVDGR